MLKNYVAPWSYLQQNLNFKFCFRKLLGSYLQQNLCGNGFLRNLGNPVTRSYLRKLKFKMLGTHHTELHKAKLNIRNPPKAKLKSKISATLPCGASVVSPS